MMRFTTACMTVLFTVGSALAMGQATPATAPAKAPSATPPAAVAPAAPTDPVEIREIEIVEAPTAAEAPEVKERRELRVIKTKDGDAFWVDETGATHELGDVMSRALQFNPEIRAIRAEIEALLARLDQLEMKTATDVVRKRVEIKQLKEKREKDKRLLDKDFIAPDELANIDTEIATREIEMKYLLGTEPTLATGAPLTDRVRVMKLLGDHDAMAFLPVARGMDKARPSLEEAPEDIRKTLDSKKFSLDFEDMAIEKITSLLAEKFGLNAILDPVVQSTPVTVNLKDVSLRQALSAIADASALVFIIRDYGIFATTRERALSIPGPSIPEGVPYREGGGAAGRRVVFAPRAEQSDKVLDYVEGRVDTLPAPAIAPAPEAATPAPTAP